MFYPERMQRVRFVVHGSVKQQAVKRLHELGSVQVTDYRDRLAGKEWSELLEAHPVSPDVRRITTQLMAVNRQLDVFSMVAPEQEEGFFKTLFAPAPPQKAAVEDLSGDGLFNEVDAAIAQIDAEVSPPLQRLEKTEVEKAELAASREAFSRISSLALPLELLGQGPFVSTCLGVALRKDCVSLRQEVEEAAGGVVFFDQVGVSETEACVMAACLRDVADEVAACFRRWDVERIAPAGFTGSPATALEEIASRNASLDREQQSCRQQIGSAGETWRLRLKALREQLVIERERADVFTSFAQTRHVVAIEGWVPEKLSGYVISEMESSCRRLVIASAGAPDEPPDKIPVKLDNPGILKHFELLVKLYASPKYDEIDPTVLIFPSFLFFFGLMITDAMYGLMCLLLGIFILRGGGRYYPLYRSAGILLSLGGATTVVLGSMTGGWFGNLATEYLGMTFLNSLVVINPMVDVAKFLLFAIGVGLVHLNIGIIAGIVKDVRRGQIKAALRFVWIFFLEAALICLYYEAGTAALMFAIPALLLLLYSEKGMALFGVTGLLGDSLSYARLMALGLVSFGLAVAINALAKMVWGIDYVGWMMAILILIGGHLFSFVLNLMGAFAHGVRLHFVEFFGKFYSGGGEEFEPFRIKRRLTELK